MDRSQHPIDALIAVFERAQHDHADDGPQRGRTAADPSEDS